MTIAAAPSDSKTPLLGLTRPALAAALGAIGVAERDQRMRASQLWHWLYQRGALSFDAMTTLSKEMRATLAAYFVIGRPEIVTEQLSADGTRKWLLRMGPGVEVETVFIPEEDRGTLCVSSQVGCTLTCRFCHTGTQKLMRNLTAGEIIAQIMVARDALDDFPAGKGGVGQRRLTNVVMMGMGEPLYNFENVRDAIHIMADGDGLALSKRRITLSTAGVVPMIERAGNEIGSMLAISLHSARDDVRDVIVPLNRKYPIAELIAACRAYPGLSNARRITFEYVMLKGINDSPDDARRLVRLLEGIPAKINLIPFNPWPGAPYACSDWEVIETFAEIVNAAGYASPIRTPRGRDIMAACGQLKSESVKQRASAALDERLASRAGEPAPAAG